jgi:hypothetical protein
MPQVVLASTGDHHCGQVDPCLPDQVGLSVVVKNGTLELVVIGRIVDCEA